MLLSNAGDPDSLRKREKPSLGVSPLCPFHIAISAAAVSGGCMARAPGSHGTPLLSLFQTLHVHARILCADRKGCSSFSSGKPEDRIARPEAT